MKTTTSTSRSLEILSLVAGITTVASMAIFFAVSLLA